MVAIPKIPGPGGELSRLKRFASGLAKDRKSPESQEENRAGLLSLSGGSSSFRGRLERLVRIGANTADAHSSFILLPTLHAPTADGVREESPSEFYLLAAHSLSHYSTPGAVTQHSFFRWASAKRQPLHVSPFDGDSRTLGLYTRRLPLKSLCAIPFPDQETFEERGVFVCDSLKSYAFTKAQIQILGDIAAEIAHAVSEERVRLSSHEEIAPAFTSWEEFTAGVEGAVRKVGARQLQVIHCQLPALKNLSSPGDLDKRIQLRDAVEKKLSPLLPENTAIFRAEGGHLFIVSDRLLAVSIKLRLSALLDSLSPRFGLSGLSSVRLLPNADRTVFLSSGGSALFQYLQQQVFQKENE